MTPAAAATLLLMLTALTACGDGEARLSPGGMPPSGRAGPPPPPVPDAPTPNAPREPAGPRG